MEFRSVWISEERSKKVPAIYAGLFYKIGGDDYSVD